MTAVNCQDKPAVAPPFSVVCDDIEGRSAGVSGGQRGGASLSPTHEATPSAWDVLCGEGELITDAREWVESIESRSDLRSAATLRCLDRLRDELVMVHESTELDSTVAVTVRDALLLSRQMLSRLR